MNSEYPTGQVSRMWLCIETRYLTLLGLVGLMKYQMHPFGKSDWDFTELTGMSSSYMFHTFMQPLERVIVSRYYIVHQNRWQEAVTCNRSNAWWSSMHLWLEKDIFLDTLGKGRAMLAICFIYLERHSAIRESCIIYKNDSVRKLKFGREERLRNSQRLCSNSACCCIVILFVIVEKKSHIIEQWR